MRFDHVPQLWPDAPQIGFKQLDSVFDLGLDHLSKLRFHFVLQITPPIIASPDHIHRGPERQFVLEETHSLGRAIATSLVDAAHKTVDLPQRLLFPCLQRMDQTLDAFFVLIDNAKSFAHFCCDLVQNNLRGLPGRTQLERMRTRVCHDQIDVLLQRSNFTLFLKAGSVRRTRARE